MSSDRRKVDVGVFQSFLRVGAEVGCRGYMSLG